MQTQKNKIYLALLLFSSLSCFCEMRWNNIPLYSLRNGIQVENQIETNFNALDYNLDSIYFSINANMDIANNSGFTLVENGRLFRRLIKVENASFLLLNFSQFCLDSNAEFNVMTYDSSLTCNFNYFGCKSDTVLNTALISGNYIYLELFTRFGDTITNIILSSINGEIRNNLTSNFNKSNNLSSVPGFYNILKNTHDGEEIDLSCSKNLACADNYIAQNENYGQQKRAISSTYLVKKIGVDIFEKNIGMTLIKGLNNSSYLFTVYHQVSPDIPTNPLSTDYKYTFRFNYFRKECLYSPPTYNTSSNNWLGTYDVREIVDYSGGTFVAFSNSRDVALIKSIEEMNYKEYYPSYSTLSNEESYDFDKPGMYYPVYVHTPIKAFKPRHSEKSNPSYNFNGFGFEVEFFNSKNLALTGNIIGETKLGQPFLLGSGHSGSPFFYNNIFRGAARTSLNYFTFTPEGKMIFPKFHYKCNNTSQEVEQITVDYPENDENEVRTGATFAHFRGGWNFGGNQYNSFQYHLDPTLTTDERKVYPEQELVNDNSNYNYYGKLTSQLNLAVDSDLYFNFHAANVLTLGSKQTSSGVELFEVKKNVDIKLQAGKGIIIKPCTVFRYECKAQIIVNPDIKRSTKKPASMTNGYLACNTPLPPKIRIDDENTSIQDFKPLNPSTLKLINEQGTYFIELNAKEADNFTITLRDLVGRDLKLLLQDYREKGIYRYQIPSESLESGIYFITLESNTSKDYIKFSNLK